VICPITGYLELLKSLMSEVDVRSESTLPARKTRGNNIPMSPILEASEEISEECRGFYEAFLETVRESQSFLSLSDDELKSLLQVVKGYHHLEKATALMELRLRKSYR